MTDIEHKALTLVKDNISNLDSLLQNKEYLEKVFGEASTIQNWSPNMRTRLYYEITDLVLNSGNINSFYKSLISINLDYNKEWSNANLFYAVVLDFGEFFKKVYEIYLLDQLYYILVKIPLEEIPLVLENENGFKTGSYNESINFGFGFHQFSLLDNEYSKYDYELYALKKSLQNKISILLENSVYRNKKSMLVAILVSQKKRNLYHTKLMFTVTSINKEKAIKRTLKKVNKDQLSLI